MQMYFLGFLFFPIFGFGFVMYFLPSIIAFARSKRDIALVWAVKTDAPVIAR
jgi:hypothetical protein